MRSADEARELAGRALAAVSGADQAEATVTLEDTAYSRFAQNYVTQNLDESSSTVKITYIKNKRMGTSSSNDTSAEGLRRLAAAAAAIASRVPANIEFVSLATKRALPAPPQSVFASTVDVPPDVRVDKLLPVFARMKQSKLNAAGYTTTQQSAFAVRNSLGVDAAFASTYGGIEIKAQSANTSGFAEYYTHDYASVDSAERADLAANKATVSREPQDLAPGTYTVLLEPPAFAIVMSDLYEGMNIGSVLEDKDSWMIGRIGKAALSPNLTIVDDWSDPITANAPFASDGAPTQKVTLVDRGVPTAYVSSTYLANKFKVPNTGHDGYPTNAIVRPGTKSREELIASIERGVLISRCWYTRVVNPRDATITGLTRDGVYLIENGKLTKTLKNFRFFTSMLTALSDVEFGNRLYIGQGESSQNPIVVPSAKIAKFTLSAQASFA